MTSFRSPFDLAKVTAIGFDLDHTLARYVLPNFQELLYNLVVDDLIRRVPAALPCKRGPYDVALGVKGMVYDRQLGHLLKIGHDRAVLAAYHGHTPLSLAQIAACYIDGRFPMEELQNKDRCYLFDTYFETALTLLFLDWVEWIDAESPSKETYGSLVQHLYDVYDYIYDDVENSPLYKQLRQSPDLYIKPRPLLASWLIRCRVNTFIISNSRWEFVDLVCKHLFGSYISDWLMLFNWAVARAQKPVFFAGEQPFVQVGSRHVMLDADVRSGAYEGGNAATLINLLSSDEVLFFEDNLTGGGAAVKRHTNWRVGMVVEELLDPIQARPSCKYFGSALDKQRWSHWHYQLDQVADMQIGCLEEFPALWRLAQKKNVPRKFLYVVKYKHRDDYREPPIAVLPTKEEASSLAYNLNTIDGADSDDAWKEYEIHYQKVPFFDKAADYFNDDEDE